MRRLLSFLLLLVAFPAFGQGTAALTCTAPTTYTNGAPIGSAAISYKFYRGASQSGPFNLETKTSSTCAATFTGLASGTHYFVVTATVAGVESANSASAPAVVPNPTPSPPTGLTITVTLAGGAGWTCTDPSGALPSSNHTREDQAQERCTNLAVANIGKVYEMRPNGVYRIVAKL